MTGSVTSNCIATSSIEEGLDLACSMLVDALQASARDEANDARGILSSLAQYVRFRYVGELRLAFEECRESRPIFVHICMNPSLSMIR